MYGSKGRVLFGRFRMESIMVALIGGAMTLVGGVVLPISRSRAVMEMKNDELTKRVKKHNCWLRARNNLLYFSRFAAGA